MADLQAILDGLKFVPDLTSRPMFGGISLYSEGRIFALVGDGEVYLKADALSEPIYDAAGSEPFVYFKADKPYAMQYWKFAPQQWPQFVPIALETARRAPFPKRKGMGR